MNGLVESLENRRLLASSSPLQWQPLGEPGSGGRIDAVAVSPHDSARVLVAGDILGSGLSTDAGRTWGPTFGWQSWEHSSFAFHPSDPNVVWAATASGPHESTDGGRTWTPRRVGLPASTGYGYPAAVETIIFDAGDPARKTLIAFGGDHRQFKDSGNPDQVPNYGKIWRSQDAGRSWSLHGTVPTGSTTAAGNNVMAATYGAGSHETLWAAVADSGVFRSSDDGGTGTWQRRSNGLPALGNGVRVTGLAAHPTNANVLFATVGTVQGNANNRARVGGVFRTTDAGLNWSRVEDGDANGYWPPNFLHVDVGADGNTIWASDDNWGGGKGLYKSTDGGTRWSHVLTQSNLAAKTVGGTPFDGASVGAWWVEIDPRNASVVYAGSSDALFKTADGGETWDDVLSTAADGGGFRGTGFTGWVANNAEFSPFDSGRLVVQGFDRLLAGVSDDGCQSFKLNQPGLPDFNGGVDAAFAADGTMFAALGQGNSGKQIARSTDGGATWQVLASPSSTSARAQGVHVDRSNANRVWAVVGDKLYRSTNAAGAAGAVTWQAISVDAKQVRQLEPVLAYQDDFYLATGGGVYYTNNGGDSFTPLGGPSNRVKLSVDPNNGNVVYAASNGDARDHGVWRRDRFAASWTEFALPGGAEYWAKDVAVDPTNSRRLAVATSQDPYADVSRATGVWMSDDGGATWRQENAGLAMLRVNAITFSPDGSRLIAGTGGRGFFVAPTANAKATATATATPAGRFSDVPITGLAGSSLFDGFPEFPEEDSL